MLTGRLCGGERRPRGGGLCGGGGEEWVEVSEIPGVWRGGWGGATGGSELVSEGEEKYGGEAVWLSRRVGGVVGMRGHGGVEGVCASDQGLCLDISSPQVWGELMLLHALEHHHQGSPPTPPPPCASGRATQSTFFLSLFPSHLWDSSLNEGWAQVACLAPYFRQQSMAL